MIKKITKITGLLTGLTTIAAITPVQAADYQILDSQEGTIYSASVKGKGIFLDGEINGKEEAVYWISEDGKYNKLDGIDTGATAKDIIFNRYLEIDDGSNGYKYVDITDNYNIVDYDVREDLENDEARLLTKKIKKDNSGRFDEDFYEGKKKISATKEGTNSFLSSGNGLAMYKYKLVKPKISGDNYSTIYTDSQGNYVDADYNLGKIQVSLTTTGSSVTIKNTEDTYKIKQDNKTYELKAEIKQNKYITMFGDTLYRYADLTIFQKEKGADDSTYVPVTSKLKFGENEYTVTDGDSVTVLQKFSKTPALDDIDGIKYSSDSKIYFIADEDGKREYLLGKSADDAVKKTGALAGGKSKLTCSGQDFYSMYLDIKDKKVYMEKFTLKTKKGFNYLDINDYDTSDVKNTDGINTPGGIPWFINNGYVQTWDGDDNFIKLFKLDRSIANISIGSKDNMIAWNKDTEVYSIVHNVTPTAKTPLINTTTTSAAVTVTTVANETARGWVLTKDNVWTYIIDDGTKKTGWLNSNGTWYYLAVNGAMATGWTNDNGTWYYLDETGAMKTGWINYKNTWYYCDSSGAMLYDTIIDGYKLGLDGAWISQ